MKDDNNKKNEEEKEKKDEEKKCCGSEKCCKGEEKESQLKEKIEEFENKYKRALADYQNLEKRTFEERREWIRTANKELILRLLPVLDTLVLVNKHVEDQGLKLAIQQFLDLLKTEGVVKINTKDKDFNPEEMECVQTKEGEEGKVLEEIRAGYIIGDKVLRPAQVVVGKE
ncbi:nucleotide exchange factor GrpE [Candidatus Microgenomates bacterium]|nr:MAG: nucleotide exchange factor GrpE [Candidatus Microgenomates bacterium]